MSVLSKMQKAYWDASRDATCKNPTSSHFQRLCENAENNYRTELLAELETLENRRSFRMRMFAQIERSEQTA